MAKKIQKQRSNDENRQIFGAMYKTGKYLFPQANDVQLIAGIKGVMKANPNATKDDFHKAAQVLAKSMKNGQFHQKLGVARIKAKIRKK